MVVRSPALSISYYIINMPPTRVKQFNDECYFTYKEKNSIYLKRKYERGILNENKEISKKNVPTLIVQQRLSISPLCKHQRFMK